MDLDKRGPCFSLGRCAITPGARDMLDACGVGAEELLRRHARGDWGDVDPEDRETNDASLRYGNRVVSCYEVYEAGARARVWVITEADRSSTTVLLPEEY